MTLNNIIDLFNLNRFFIITLYEKVTVKVKLKKGFLTVDNKELKVK